MTLKKKREMYNEKLKKEREINNINGVNFNIDFEKVLNNYFQNFKMKIKILDKNYRNFQTKIFFTINKLFHVILYFDTKTIKISLGGKKEHYSFHNNKFSFLESKKIHKIDNAKSKFLIYKKLKKILLEKFKVQNKISRPFYFCKIISIYSKIFKEKCIICNKIVKFNSIDKNFYPPLIYDNENSNYNEKINCFHEECYSIFINE